jgi:hypothetical protein
MGKIVRYKSEAVKKMKSQSDRDDPEMDGG